MPSFPKGGLFNQGLQGPVRETHGTYLRHCHRKLPGSLACSPTKRLSSVNWFMSGNWEMGHYSQLCDPSQVLANALLVLVGFSVYKASGKSVGSPSISFLGHDDQIVVTKDPSELTLPSSGISLLAAFRRNAPICLGLLRESIQPLLIQSPVVPMK